MPDALAALHGNFKYRMRAWKRRPRRHDAEADEKASFINYAHSFDTYRWMVHTGVGARSECVRPEEAANCVDIDGKGRSRAALVATTIE